MTTTTTPIEVKALPKLEMETELALLVRHRVRQAQEAMNQLIALSRTEEIVTDTTMMSVSSSLFEAAISAWTLLRRTGEGEIVKDEAAFIEAAMLDRENAVYTYWQQHLLERVIDPLNAIRSEWCALYSLATANPDDVIGNDPNSYSRAFQGIATAIQVSYDYFATYREEQFRTLTNETYIRAWQEREGSLEIDEEVKPVVPIPPAT